MAELTFKSPGVSTREIDLSGPTQSGPSGIPAGVIGTAKQGRAFVPITVATFADFVAEFGDADSTLFGPLAMKQWLGYASAGTFVRTLGAGNGKKRGTDGTVTNGGFIVGSQQVQSNGNLGNNAYAGNASSAGGLGRTHFLAVIMEEANSSAVFTDAGLASVQPILRGVLMAPSGVNLALSSSRYDTENNTPFGGPGATNQAAEFDFGSSRATDKDAGSTLGAVNIAGGRQEFVMLQNGHKHTDSYPTILTASFDPAAPNYFGTIFNTDPEKMEQAGHYLYAHFDIHPNFAVCTGSSMMAPTYAATGSLQGTYEGQTFKNEEIAFLVTGSTGRAGGSTTVPDFESFSDRFRTAKFPTVISQEFGGQNKDLFTVHCLDDGAIGNHRTKISIENIIKSTNVNNKYGSFDLLVREYDDTDNEPKTLERFVKLSLDPNSERYICRVIGDYHIFYDFDKRVGGQKLIVEGSYANASNYIRISPSVELERGEIPDIALPVGFRGIQHLATSGSSIFGAPDLHDVARGTITADVAQNIVQMPVPLRRTIAQGQAPKKRINPSLYWGVQMEKQLTVAEPNGSTVLDDSLRSFGTYFPNYHQTERPVLIDGQVGVADESGTILDADRFNNNKFSLENIQVVTKNDAADPLQWPAAVYRRTGEAAGTMVDIDGSNAAAFRLLDVAKDFGLSTARPFLKFTMIAQGGFDGLNVFDAHKSDMSSTAVRREMNAENQGLTAGPTVAAYRKALDVMAERSDVDIQLLAIPGIRHSSVTDYAITTVEDRFDALFLMDIETEDNLGNIVSGSSQDVSVTGTASTFNSRNLDSSFAAAYFPDVMLQQSNGSVAQVPPSVAVLGAFGLNDSVAFPWYAPAGFTRGALRGVDSTQVNLNRTNLDTLYEADINPITSFPQSSGVVVFGQKTLLAAQSALDRVNVRRLLIDIRRQVRKIGDTFLFEPNRESTLARFSAAVTPILTRIQSQQGLERFKVQIDTTTTTQADIENNTVRGKIFLQPVRSVEFISLDFVVTNAGMDI